MGRCERAWFSGLLGVLLLWCAACGSGAKPEPPPTAPPIEKPASTIAPVAVPTASVLSVPAARAFLERWVSTQNQGDFDGYQALYAERFRGTKRSGPRVRHFDRAGWVSDRARMFKQTMHVDVSDVKIQAWSRAAEITFTQAWTSPTFSDVGPKRLLLVAGSSGPEIATEEMLASNIGRQGTTSALDAHDFRFLARTNHLYVVITSDPDVSWAGNGAVELDAGRGADISAARRKADASRVPTDIRSSVPEQIRLYGASGPVCTATVGDLYLLRRVVVHFGTRQYWNGEVDLEEGAAPAPVLDQVVADGIWGEAEDTLLVAELTPDATHGSAGCDAALWAREVERPEPTVFQREELAPDHVLRRQLLDAVAALPSYRRIAADYRTHGKETSDALPTRWENFEQGSPTFTAWRGAGRELFSVDMSVGGCGSFGGTLHVVLERRGPLFVRVAESQDWLSVDAIVDVNSDTLLELVLSGPFMRRGTADSCATVVDHLITITDEVTPPFHDCGC